MQQVLRLADHVGAIAARLPDRLAVVTNGRIVTYGEMHRLIRRVAAALARLGPAAGRCAAIGFVEPFEHLLVLAAYDLLGVVTASFRPGEGEDADPLFARADLVVTDTELPAGLCKRQVRLDADWFVADRASDPLDGRLVLPPAWAEQPVSIARSSGTTGRSKRMIMTRGMINARCAQRTALYGMGADGRLFVGLHLSVQNVVLGVMLSWRVGAMVVIETRLPLALALAATGATHVALLPYQLETYLAELPADFGPLPGLTVLVVGGRTSAALRASVLARLAGRMVEQYGTMEAGMICELRPDRTGTLSPGTEVAILDPDGGRLPPGATGRLAVRGPGVVHGYVDDEALTTRHFRGGWCISNDLAAVLEDGRLQLVGRDAEVLHVGGVKMACADIESALRAAPEIADAAVLTAADDTAAGVIVAVTVRLGARAETAAEAARGCLPALLAEASVRIVPAIPRTETGKARRAALRALLA